MDRAAFCSALEKMTHAQIESQIAGWKQGLGFPAEINAPLAALIESLTDDQMSKVKLMMKLNAGSALCQLLNVLDGTGDVEGQPSGRFHQTFVHWDGARNGEVETLTPENADFLHDLFMEAHMRELESEAVH